MCTRGGRGRSSGGGGVSVGACCGARRLRRRYSLHHCATRDRRAGALLSHSKDTWRTCHVFSTDASHSDHLCMHAPPTPARNTGAKSKRAHSVKRRPRLRRTATRAFQSASSSAVVASPSHRSRAAASLGAGGADGRVRAAPRIHRPGDAWRRPPLARRVLARAGQPSPLQALLRERALDREPTLLVAARAEAAHDPPTRPSVHPSTAWTPRRLEVQKYRAIRAPEYRKVVTRKIFQKYIRDDAPLQVTRHFRDTSSTLPRHIRTNAPLQIGLQAAHRAAVSAEALRAPPPVLTTSCRRRLR